MFSFMDVLLSFSEVSKKYFVSWNCSVCSFMGFVLYFVPRFKLSNYWVKVLIFIGNLSVIFFVAGRKILSISVFERGMLSRGSTRLKT